MVVVICIFLCRNKLSFNLNLNLILLYRQSLKTLSLSSYHYWYRYHHYHHHHQFHHNHYHYSHYACYSLSFQIKIMLYNYKSMKTISIPKMKWLQSILWKLYRNPSTDGQTARQTTGRTRRNQYYHPPTLCRSLKIVTICVLFYGRLDVYAPIFEIYSFSWHMQLTSPPKPISSTVGTKLTVCQRLWSERGTTWIVSSC